MAQFFAKAARALSLALMLLCGATAAAAEPTGSRLYTLDDLLNQAAFGGASIDPTDRWIVFEQAAPYTDLPRYDYGLYNRAASNTLWIAESRSSARPERLLPESEGVGHVIGEWSPSGRRLLIYRLQNARWRAGVIDMITRDVRWLDVDPDGGGFGRVAQWRSDDELILIDRRSDALPFVMGWDTEAMELTRERWARQANGRESSATQMGSGRFKDETPVSPAVDIVRLDLRSGEKTVLSTGRFVDLELSPDRAFVAAMSQGEMPPVDQDRPLWPVDKPEARHVEIIEIQTGAVRRPCANCAVAPHLMGWSPDGSRVLVWITGPNGPTSGELAAFSTDGGMETFDRFGLEPDVTATQVASFTAVRAVWQDDRPVLRARRIGETRYDWHRLDRSGAVNLTAGLEAPPNRIDIAQGRELTGVADGGVWRFRADGSREHLSDIDGLRGFSPFDVLDAPRSRYNEPAAGGPPLAVNAEGRLTGVSPAWRLPRSTPDDALVTPLAASERQVVEETVRNGVRTLSLRRSDGSTRALATVNAYLADVDFAEPTAVAHIGPDGEALTSWLYLPTREAQGRVPLVVLAYPGRVSRAQRDPAEFMTELNFQQLTAAGYAVLTPSVPRPFYPGEPGVGLADQLLTVVDAALAQNPDLDPDRLIYWGQSFGGYSGLVVSTQTTRFRSIVVQAVVSNLSEKWGEFAPWNRADPRWGVSMRHDAGWAEASQGGMGGPPWADPDRYVRNSPLFNAGAIETPILVMQGERDMGLGQAESLFTALWRQNKDVRFVTWWGEGHTVESVANLREMYRQILSWLEETAGPRSQDDAQPASPSVVANSPPERRS
ncbi:prolyl oligopeptidase family serine peptidase [Brevundimonas sp.]|uniref:S9 family peptidase n=1 Tax=Brevundimonas sp. TaxID=1871086 RepID=UPI0035AE5287